jgi:hypothetical protein
MKHHRLGDLNVAKQNKRKQRMCQIVALPFTLKKYLKAKEETQIFHLAKI